MEITKEQFDEYLRLKKEQNKYLTSNEYPSSIKWECMMFKFNPYLSKGQRKSSDVKCFVKQFTNQTGKKLQLQMWYGKTLYLFDIVDATPEQQVYNIKQNIVNGVKHD